MPHEPGHGSTHFNLRQAWLKGQSESMVHCGRHGEPKNPGRQEHTAFSLSSDRRHSELGPHGLGWHGDTGGSGGGTPGEETHYI